MTTQPYKILNCSQKVKLHSSFLRRAHSEVETSLLTVMGTLTTKKMQQSNINYWHCTVCPKSNLCKALVTQRNGKFIKNNLCHSHPPSTGSDITTKVTLQVKKLPAQDLFKPASAIVDDVLQEMGNAPCPSLPKPEHLE